MTTHMKTHCMVLFKANSGTKIANKNGNTNRSPHFVPVLYLMNPTHDISKNYRMINPEFSLISQCKYDDNIVEKAFGPF